MFFSREVLKFLLQSLGTGQAGWSRVLTSWRVHIGRAGTATTPATLLQSRSGLTIRRLWPGNSTVRQAIWFIGAAHNTISAATTPPFPLKIGLHPDCHQPTAYLNPTSERRPRRVLLGPSKTEEGIDWHRARTCPTLTASMGHRLQPCRRPAPGDDEHGDGCVWSLERSWHARHARLTLGHHPSSVVRDGLCQTWHLSC